MTKSPEICSVCAWRDTCKKRFSLSGRDVRCPDFVEDVSFEKESDEQEEKAEGED
ncbi:MAG: hypothetical protein P8Y77_10415 [Nitrospirota bacterium]|jgi:hypothetical protein